MDYRYYIGKALDAENDKAKNIYLDQARNEQTKSVLESEREARIITERELKEEKEILSTEREKSDAIRTQSVKIVFTLLNAVFIWVPTIIIYVIGAFYEK